MLAVTLRYLASGNFYSDMQYGFRMATSSISESVREVCQAIVHEFWDEFIRTPQNKAEWCAVADEFQRRWNFHHTLGSIDGKHVPIQKPPHAGSDYWNYKKFNSIIILGVVDTNYKFLWLNIGTRGAAGDAQIWNESALKHALVNNTLPIPQPEPLPHDTTDIPYYFWFRGISDETLQPQKSHKGGKNF